MRSLGGRTLPRKVYEVCVKGLVPRLAAARGACHGSCTVFFDSVTELGEMVFQPFGRI